MLTTIKPFGKISSTVVEAFERCNQLILPDDYKKFLISSNGGLVELMTCYIEKLNESVLLEVLLGIDQQERSFNMGFWLNRFHDEMPKGFIVIGLGSTGMFILGTDDKREDLGVYFWDDAHAFKGSSEGGNTYRVAKSFTEFLGSLKPL